ncbi:hypothetical protein P3T73_11235 [Kiritimatiellota bacterium B12222]|nr:hypothetical protein P3T73_11235 [Kiritimatiellota bacterium B12222]
MSAPSSIPQPWNRTACKVRDRVNAGWFWVYFSRLMLMAFGLCAFLIWLLRLQRVEITPALALGAGLLVVSGLWAHMFAAPKFISMETALSRLDVGWQLNHRLVSAWQGVGEWPPMPANRPLPLQLKTTPVVLPLLLCIGGVLLAQYLPLPPQKIITKSIRKEPPDWTAMDALADRWEQLEVIEPESTHALRRELELLRKKPAEEWYDPASLEATDRLRSRIRSDATRLSDAMSNTSSLLKLAHEGRMQLSTPQQQAMQEFLQQMQAQLQEGGLKLTPEMMQQLEQVDLSQLQQIDAQQLQQLEQQLMQNAQQLEQALVQAGIVQGFGESPGRGGVGQGGGPSELTLANFESILEPIVPMALTPGELENARIGDLLELRETEHDDDRVDVGQSGGQIVTPGGSGEVVWDQDFLPSEQKVLKAFFN